VFFVINDLINSETGVRPLDAMFGSADGPYLRLPAEGLPADITNAWVVALDADLKKIRQISKEYQEQLQILLRSRPNNADLSNQTISGHNNPPRLLSISLCSRYIPLSMVTFRL
jgi:hypothetical protein